MKQVSGGYPLYYLWSSVLGEPVVELDGSGGVYRAYVTSSGGQMMGVQSYDGNFYWLHTDHLGNGRKLTNASGTVVYRAEFDPHGQILRGIRRAIELTQRRQVARVQSNLGRVSSNQISTEVIFASSSLCDFALQFVVLA
ncbi:MAG: RHS domain-containing protein [Blastocatellales bacterium]